MTSAIFTRCAGGASSYELLHPVTPGATTRYPCSGAESHVGYFIRNLVGHFKMSGCKNPYNAKESCVSGFNTTPSGRRGTLGQTYLVSRFLSSGGVVVGSSVELETNIGDEDGNQVILFDKVVRE